MNNEKIWLKPDTFDNGGLTIDEKIVGIYERSKETREVLCEVLEMLCRFRREIGYYDVETKESKANEPTCFKDEVATIHTLAFAIKGDLLKIMKEFG